MNSIKRFLKNKTVVTILGVLLIVGILIGGYTYRVNTTVKPVSVPVAAVTIAPKTAITSDMIKMVEMPESYISSNAIKSSDALVGMYANYNTVIPAGSMFYNETVTTLDKLPNSILSLLSEGEIAYTMDVDGASKFANIIMPNDKIDIYLAITDENGNVMLGKFLENVKVLAVKDSEGNNSFDVTDGSRTPAYYVFGFKDSIHLMMMRSEKLNIEYIVVPHGEWVDDENAVINVTTQELINYINAHSVKLSSDPVS